MGARRPPDIAFVLSGGASLGAVQVGMLRALYEREIVPDLIIGSSVGAINGTFIAGRPPTLQTIDELGDLWRGLTRSAVFPLGVRSGLLGLVGRRPGLFDPAGLRKLLVEHLGLRRLDDASIPVRVVAADVLSGVEVCIEDGDAVTAVLASAAIPGVFPPVHWRGRFLIDGGVCNDTPISQAIEAGARTVYVLPTGNACGLTEPPRGTLEIVLHALSLLMMRHLLAEIERFKDRAELVVLPPPCPLTVRPIDFRHADELIARGFADSKKYLADLGAGRAAAPLHMHMHGHRS